MDFLRICGARQHNPRNVSADSASAALAADVNWDGAPDIVRRIGQSSW